MSLSITARKSNWNCMFSLFWW